jgi:hypothetical protein
MKKVFLSQPMKGKTDEEIDKRRIEAISWINDRVIENKDESWMLIKTKFDDDYDICQLPEDRKGLFFLARSLGQMVNADLIVMVDDWENYRGCRIEHETAKSYNIPIIYFRTDTQNLTFDEAMFQIFHGKQVARRLWEDTAILIYQQDTKLVSPDSAKNPALKRFMKEHGSITIQDHIDMIALIDDKSTLVVNWYPVAEDIFAKDWYVV